MSDATANANYQRVGAVSNAHVGRDFEARAKKILAEHNLPLELNFKVPVGIEGAPKKRHAFDLGSDEPAILVECKCQTWTAGNKVPSAKMKNWAEAMYYFHIAPANYRKIFFVEKSVRATNGETLLAYFRRTQAHMIPSDVEFWELDRDSDDLNIDFGG